MNMRMFPSYPYHSRSHGSQHVYPKKIYLPRPAGSKQSTTIHETKPPIPHPQTKGWHLIHTTYTTTPINPVLDSAPTRSFEITRHPTNDNEVLLHVPDGRLLTRMRKARLQKLIAIYKHVNDKATLPEALAELTHKHSVIGTTHNQITETRLHKRYKLIPHQDLNRTWPILDIIYDAFQRCVNIQRVIHCNPINLPLRA